MKQNIAWWVIGWRLALTGLSLVAIWAIPYKPSFPFSDAILSRLGSRWLTSWASFDGVHYLTIIEHGYKSPFSGSVQAFFPLYPLLVAIVTKLNINVIVVGVGLSSLFFTIALWFLYKLINRDENKRVAIKTILLMLLAPTSFFFTSMYTESLFLLLIVLSFYMARMGKFWQAGWWGLLAAATRSIGVLLVPALLVEMLLQKRKRILNRENWGNIVASFLPVAGLGAYMAYLNRVFGDALLFIHVQPQFGVQREVERLVLPYQVFWRYAKMVVTVEPTSLTYYSVWLELSTAILFLGLAVLAFYKTRKSYAVFTALALVVPTLTGTFTSLPRYVLVLFPAFVVLAKLLTGRKYKLALIISGILLIINTMLFIQGYWVA